MNDQDKVNAFNEGIEAIRRLANKTELQGWLLKASDQWTDKMKVDFMTEIVLSFLFKSSEAEYVQTAKDYILKRITN